MRVVDRVTGGLLGLAAGDALGATCEFESPAQRGQHRDIVGGGMLGWRPGQGTDDSDLAIALARVYADGFDLTRAAEAFAAWYRTDPRDVGGMTAAALDHYLAGEPADTCGSKAAGQLGPARAAGNGSLMRCLATGLVRTDATTRRREAVAVSAITHADRRCTGACAAYVDLVALLLEGATAAETLSAVVADGTLDDDVRAAVRHGMSADLDGLDFGGYVLATLAVGAWALAQPQTPEELLVAIVNQGDDADTTGAVAGGLLGVRDGATAIPDRWARALEYGPEIRDLGSRLAEIRLGG